MASPERERKTAVAIPMVIGQRVSITCSLLRASADARLSVRNLRLGDDAPAQRPYHLSGVSRARRGAGGSIHSYGAFLVRLGSVALPVVLAAMGVFFINDLQLRSNSALSSWRRQRRPAAEKRAGLSPPVGTSAVRGLLDCREPVPQDPDSRLIEPTIGVGLVCRRGGFSVVTSKAPAPAAVISPIGLYFGDATTGR